MCENMTFCNWITRTLILVLFALAIGLVAENVGGCHQGGGMRGGFCGQN